MVSHRLAGQIPFHENPRDRLQKKRQSPASARLFCTRRFFDPGTKLKNRLYLFVHAALISPLKFEVLTDSVERREAAFQAAQNGRYLKSKVKMATDLAGPGGVGMSKYKIAGP
jgi:hypothetical protein